MVFEAFFFHFIDLAVINSWLMWRKIHNRKESLADFKSELGSVLCKKGFIVSPSTRGRPLQAKIAKKNIVRKLLYHHPTPEQIE